MYLTNGTLLQGRKYKIVRHIASGGFGNPYEALDVNLNKRVAIKEFFVKDFCNRDETTSQVSVGITSKTALVDKLKGKFSDNCLQQGKGIPFRTQLAKNNEQFIRPSQEGDNHKTRKAWYIVAAEDWSL